MIQSLLSLAAVPGALIVVSGGFNAIFFANYSATQARRRVGALVLALVNLSFLLQGLYWLALSLRSGYDQTLVNGNALIVRADNPCFIAGNHSPDTQAEVRR